MSEPKPTYTIADCDGSIGDCPNRGEIERLRARIAELEAAARWIPVGERLPEMYQEVYTYCFGNTYNPYGCGSYSGKRLEYYQAQDGEYFWSFTHWRPLPSAPEAE
jgi:hypothetical protein